MNFTNELIQLSTLENALKVFGAKLRKARKTLELTQEDVGRLIGRAGNTVALIERGIQPPGWEAIEAIFSKLGQPPNYYFSPDIAVIQPRETTPEEALDIIRKALEAKQAPASPPSLPIGLPEDFLDQLGRLEQHELAATAAQVGSYLKKKSAKESDPGRDLG